MGKASEINKPPTMKVVDTSQRAEPRVEPRVEPAPTLPPPPPQDTKPARAPVGRKRIIIIGIALAVLSLIGWQGYRYLTVGRFLVTTDDAYVGAEPALVASKLAAYVVEVPVRANEVVRKGDVLVEIDPAEYRTALAQAQARLATQRATIARIRTQATAADAGIAQAEAQLAAAEADIPRAQAAFDRAQRLQVGAIASRAAFDIARADRERSLAQKAAAEAGVRNARAARELADAQRVEAERTADELAVAVEKAQRDFEATRITAPIDGMVAAKSVQVGDYVSAGKRLLTLVPIASVFVDANFKETQVGRVVAGMSATVTVDAYPDRVFTGTVTGLAPATGSVTSLLPPENATGNFTKIVQRLPVRIAIVQQPDALLRPGMSVVASIDVRTAPKR
ncbi:MAG: HlyD family secretion protein [Hyphomicrobiales bacterium]|nr:HlyD family secretion protein [Hyphomicrobiales bacterium]